MANRGGFKPTTSLRPEQMQGMGINTKEMQNATITQPPTYPPLVNRPIMPEITPERDFVITWKDDFQKYLKNSPYYTDADVADSKYYQRYYLESTRSERKFGSFTWDHMPAELKPNFKRKHSEKTGPAKAVRLVNVEETLKVLEQKEVSSKKKHQDNDVTKEQKDSEDENENVEDEEHDDEMDEDNDYLDNYFDNGDDYNEEDDNLDDGPIY